MDWLRVSKISWECREFVTLRECLLEGCAAKSELRSLAANAGLDVHEINPDGAPRIHANDVLEVAARAGGLVSLVCAFLQDPRCAAGQGRLVELLFEMDPPSSLRGKPALALEFRGQPCSQTRRQLEERLPAILEALLGGAPEQLAVPPGALRALVILGAEGVERLSTLHERGLLDSLAGFPILEVHRLSREEAEEERGRWRFHRPADAEELPLAPLGGYLGGRSSGRRFRGRGALLEEIDHLFEEHRVVVLHGLGGMGKSELAAAFARRAREEEGLPLVHWISAQNEAGPRAKEVIEDGLMDLSEPLFGREVPASQQARSIAARQIVARLSQLRGWLLVVDDVLEPDAIAGLIPASGGRVLITSRRSAWSEFACLDVGLPPLEEAVEILQNYARIGAGEEKPGSNAADLRVPSGVMPHGVPMLWQVRGLERWCELASHPGLDRRPWVALVSGLSESRARAELERGERALVSAGERAGVALAQRDWFELPCLNGSPPRNLDAVLPRENEIGTPAQASQLGRRVGLALRPEGLGPSDIETWSTSIESLVWGDGSEDGRAILVHLDETRSRRRRSPAEQLAGSLRDRGVSTLVGHHPSWADAALRTKTEPRFGRVSLAEARWQWRAGFSQAEEELPSPEAVITDLASQKDPLAELMELARGTAEHRPRALPSLLEASACSPSRAVRTAGFLACVPHDLLLDRWLHGVQEFTDLVDLAELARRPGSVAFLVMGLLRGIEPGTVGLDGYLAELAPALDDSGRALVDAWRRGELPNDALSSLEHVIACWRAGLDLPLRRIPDELLLGAGARWDFWGRAWLEPELADLLRRPAAVRAVGGLLTKEELDFELGLRRGQGT